MINLGKTNINPNNSPYIFFYFEQNMNIDRLCDEGFKLLLLTV